MKTNQFIPFYETYKTLIAKHSCEAMNSCRAAAFGDFERLGFAAENDDYYRWLDLEAMFATDYGLNVNRLLPQFDPYKNFHCDVPGITSWLFYVVNDVFVGTTAADLPEGVVICSMREAGERYPKLLAKYYGVSVDTRADGVQAFNMAFAQDGFFMYVPSGVVLEKPVQLVNVLSGKTAALAVAHNLVIVERGAKAKIVVCDHTMDNVPLAANRITEVFVGENAEYDHYKIESTNATTNNISTLNVRQASASNVVTNIITLHNGTTRNNINIDLQGEGAATTLCGMFIGGSRQYTDNATSIAHHAPNCRSTELFKYILDDEAKGNFLGRILVADGARQTEALQTNRNICLTNKARMYTKPQLEIYNDDVKCSHGATVGQLDDQALFYMRQRGIPEHEARLLLMSAFATDVLENIRIEQLRDRIRLLVDKRLRGDASRCEGCVMCK